MEMMNALTADELNAMRSYIGNYADEGGESLTSREVENLDMTHILRFWAQEKQTLFQMFGEKLILTKHISCKKSQRELEADIDNMLTDYESKGRLFFKSYTNWSNDFWDKNRKLYYDLRDLMSFTSLSSNVYCYSTFSIPLPDGKKLTVNSGCKTSKILGKIAAAFNLEGYEDFRVAHSMCLNQKNIEGEICLSIHPLDYMTMSDNTCDWSSCMSWMGGGDYRQGTVEMMNSPCVVVAYLKSNSKLPLDGYYEWNSKKWRQLYIVDNDVIMSIRQYPYDNDDLDTFCLRWLYDLSEKHYGFGTFHPQMCKLRNGTDNYLAFLDRSVFCHFSTSFMYNDVYLEHNAFVRTGVKDINIHYSGVSECMCCGAVIEEDPDEIPTSTLLCANCGNFRHCEECGRTISDDDYYWVDNNCICADCYNNYTTECDWCGEYHFIDNMIKVYLKHKGEYVPDACIHICTDCQNYSQSFTEEVGRVEYDKLDYRYYIDTANLKSAGYDLFSIDEDDLNPYDDDEEDQ